MDNTEANATLLATAVQDLLKFRAPQLQVLDFGCGAGHLVQELRTRGFDAEGCDVQEFWPEPTPRLRVIDAAPYRLPYEDERFDVVVSTSVLEHAQDKRACFGEIRRVLKSGGAALHLFPARWSMPVEPHIFVPLANFWRQTPHWWLALWAWAGVRNQFQADMPWRAVVAANEAFCRDGLSYWSTTAYSQLSREVFGNVAWPMAFYVEHADGGFARLARRLPFRRLSGLVSRETRMAFLLQRK